MADFYPITVDGITLKIPVVHRSLNEGFIRGAPEKESSTGCEPRDFSVDPVDMRDSPDSMQVYDNAEAVSRFQKALKDESSLIHRYLRGGKPAFEHLDQDGFLDCWYHGPCHAVMLACMRDNEPVPRLNGVAGATLLGRTNGGWSGLGQKDLRENGAPLMGNGPGEWPQWTRDKKYNTPEFKANRLKLKVLEDWYDLGSAEWDQELNKAQIITCGIDNNPGSYDYNRFGHAMACPGVGYMDGRFHPVTLNSWKDFGLFGLALLYDIWPDSAVAVRSTTPR
jgi:hypothetical protein